MILAIIVGLIAAAMAYLLLSPISIYICYDFDKKNLTSAGISIYPFAYKFKVGAKTETQAKPKKLKSVKLKIKQPKKRGPNFMLLLFNEFDLIKEVLADVFALLIRLVKSPHRYFAYINLGGGLGTPDLTGQLYGGLEMIKPVLGNSVSIKYRPDFLAESLTGQATLGLAVRLGNILKELLIFVWRLPKLRLIKIYRKMK